MQRPRNTTQVKEQTRNTKVQINEEEIGKLPEKEFKIMIVKMIKNLENKMENMQDQLTKTQNNYRINIQRQKTQFLNSKINKKNEKN